MNRFSFLKSAVFFFAFSCAAIPANKIKIDEYPKIDQSDKSKVTLKYETFKFEPDKKGYSFDSPVLSKLNENINGDSKAKCEVKISTMHSAPFPRVCIVNYVTSFFTLFVLPYYCQHTYEIKSLLISYPQDSQIHGTIKTSIREAKLGDIFLDENDRPAKLLKTYELKDKVHEVWSLLWFLTWFAVEPNKYSSIQNKYLEVGRHPDVAKTETENTISEALVRQVIHDASTFEECKKSILTN